MMTKHLALDVICFQSFLQTMTSLVCNLKKFAICNIVIIIIIVQLKMIQQIKDEVEQNVYILYVQDFAERIVNKLKHNI